MSVSAINSATSTNTATDTDTTLAARIPQKALGQDDFLKLLTIQLQQQDPMKPMEDTAFIAQMAQFSSLQQSTTMVQQMTQLQNSQDLVTANSYIGREVAVEDGEGNVVSGEVSGVDIEEGVPRVVIGEFSYPLSAVLTVKPGVPAATAETVAE